MVKTDFEEDYVPQKTREIKEVRNKLNQKLKSVSVFRMLSETKAYRDEYYDLLWELTLDTYTKLFIEKSTDGTEDGMAKLILDKEANPVEYVLKDPEKAWDAIKEEAYNDYIIMHLESDLVASLSKEMILKKIREAIESRILFIMNLLREKP